MGSNQTSNQRIAVENISNFTPDDGKSTNPLEPNLFLENPGIRFTGERVQQIAQSLPLKTLPTIDRKAILEQLLQDGRETLAQRTLAKQVERILGTQDLGFRSGVTGIWEGRDTKGITIRLEEGIVADVSTEGKVALYNNKGVKVQMTAKLLQEISQKINDISHNTVDSFR